MSMLADKKRKQKFVTNFRSQTSWSQDASKFGQRMLEKMGWKDGKGLGRNEDGLTKNISMVLKNDMQGLGFNESIHDSLQHDNFNSLLETLTNDSNASSTTDTVQIKSLEKRSENSRVRVHYAKFTRGKDLSKYSQKDLANIFGKSKLGKDNDEMAKKIDAEICGGSMHDYFKNKMKLANKAGSCENTIVENEGENAIKTSKKSKKRKRNAEQVTQSEGLVNPGFDPLCKPALTTRTTPDTSIEGFVNPGFDPLFKTVSTPKTCLNTIIESVNESDISEIQEVEENASLEEINDVDQSENKKIKRSKKRKKLQNDSTGLSNPAFNLNTPDVVNANSENYEVKPKKNKRKVREARTTKDGLINPGFDINAVDNSLNNVEIVTSSKKKSKIGIDNQGYDVKMQNIEEIVNGFTDAIDQYQAEVENGINESKAGKKNGKRKSKRRSS